MLGYTNLTLGELALLASRLWASAGLMFAPGTMKKLIPGSSALMTACRIQSERIWSDRYENTA